MFKSYGIMRKLLCTCDRINSFTLPASPPLGVTIVLAHVRHVSIQLIDQFLLLLHCQLTTINQSEISTRLYQQIKDQY